MCSSTRWTQLSSWPSTPHCQHQHERLSVCVCSLSSTPHLREFVMCRPSTHPINTYSALCLNYLYIPRAYSRMTMLGFHYTAREPVENFISSKHQYGQMYRHMGA